MCNQPPGGPTEAAGHLQCVDDELGAHVRRELPADDRAAVAVEDEGEVDEAAPAADVGQVGHPLLVRAGGAEVALQEVAGPLEGGLVGDRRPLAAAAPLAFEPLGAHQPGDPVAADLDAAPAQLLPGLPGAIDAPVAGAGGVDLRDQLPVLELAAGRHPGSARVVRAHRHADRSADRLDPEGIPPFLHIAGHRRRVGSSS